MASNRITLQVDFQTANAEQNVKQLNQQIKNIGTTSQESSSVATNAMKGFSVTVEQVSASLSKLLVSLTGLGVAALTREWINLGEAMRAANFALSMNLGADAAKKFGQEMLALADYAGKDVTEITKIGAKLTSVFKVPQEDASKMILTFLDLGAKAGQSMEQVASMADLFGKAWLRGSITAKEAYQGALNLGLDIGPRLAKAMGITQQELKKRLTETQGDVQIALRGLLTEFAQFSAGAAGEFAKNDPGAQLRVALNDLKVQATALFEDAVPYLIKFVQALRILIAAIGEVTKAIKDAVAWAEMLYNSYDKLSDSVKAALAFVRDLAITIAICTVVIKAHEAAVIIVKGVYAGWAAITTAVAIAQQALAVATTEVAVALGVEELEAGLIIAALTTVIYLVTSSVWPNFAKTIKDTIGGAWEYLANKVKAATEWMGGAVENIRKRIADTPLTLPSADTEGFKRALEAAQNALDEARSRNLKAGMEAIEALAPTFEEEQRKVDKLHVSQMDKAKLLAIYQRKLAVDLDTEVKKRQEERHKETLKNMEEDLRYRRQIVVAQAQLVPDETITGRQRIAEVQAQAYAQQLQDTRAFEEARINEKLDADMRGNAKLMAQGRITAAEYLDAYKKLDQQAADQKTSLAIKTADAIAEHELKAQGEKNKLIYEDWKRTQDEMLQDDLAAISRRTELTKGYMEAQRVATVGQRAQQLDEISRVEQQGLQDTTQRQIEANNAVLEKFRADHADHLDSIAEMEKNTARDNYNLRRDLDTATQKNRLELWKETDALILEEEMRFFDSLKGFWGNFWDAITDKSKSVWANLGAFIQKTLMNITRDVVTSRLAAAFMPITGYPSPTFPTASQPGKPFFAPLTPAPRPETEFPHIMEAVSIIKYETVEAMHGLDASAVALATAGNSLNNSAANLNISASNLLNASAGVALGGGGGGGGGGAAVLGQLQSARNIMQANAASTETGGVSLPAGVRVAAMTGGIAMPPPPVFTEATTIPGTSLPFPSVASAYSILPPPPMISSAGAMPGLGATTIPGTSLPFPSTFGASNLAAPRLPIGLGTGFSSLLKSFGVGSPMFVEGQGVVPWGVLSPTEKLGIIAHSPAMASLLTTAGLSVAMGGMQRGGQSVLGNVQTTIGGAMTGAGLASLFGAGIGAGVSMAAGGILGAGVGLAAAGLQRGGKIGLGMSVGGGALAGAVIGNVIFPGLGALAGAAIGAGVGAIAGGIRMIFPSLDQRIRDMVKSIYGVDIRQKSVRDQIAQITNQNYGGTLSLAIFSPEVQNIVRLYALSQGANISGALPRPEYPATFMQSGAGGLQLQPTYSGGQMVANPYTGVTTSQYSMVLSELQGARNAPGSNPLYLQLNPQQALQLFSGQVVGVIGQNPGVVASANTVATQSGISRMGQAASLMEPLTVTR